MVMPIMVRFKITKFLLKRTYLKIILPKIANFHTILFFFKRNFIILKNDKMRYNVHLLVFSGT